MDIDVLKDILADRKIDISPVARLLGEILITTNKPKTFDYGGYRYNIKYIIRADTKLRRIEPVVSKVGKMAIGADWWFSFRLIIDESKRYCTDIDCRFSNEEEAQQKLDELLNLFK